MFSLALLNSLSFSAPLPDLVVFDEDDPLGRDYYDASIGSASGGAALELLAKSLDKMPVTTNASAIGKVSGVLAWDTQSGGEWRMHIFRPGFGLLPVDRYDAISLALNGPLPIPAEELPLLELRDLRGRIVSAPLGDLLEAGIDGDNKTWQHVRLSISMLKGDRRVDFGRVKHVTFSHRAISGGKHLLWVDDLRLLASERLVATRPPPAPVGLVSRAGDRSLTLHWQPVEGHQVQRYRVYRSEREHGTFTEVADSPVLSASVADVRVENDETYFYQVRAENEAGLGLPSTVLSITPQAFSSNDQFLEYLQATAFNYFWFEANPKNGMIRDRSQPWSAASVAAMGFGFSAIAIGVDHRWITREQGAERVLRTLQTLWSTPQGRDESRTSGHKGWFYHFLDFDEATRFGTSELSSIDTALLLAGMLDASEFFAGNSAEEKEIRSLAKRIFNRVDWKWMLNEGSTLSMGWHPENGFIKARWQGYNEASILYLLGLGASSGSALQPMHWENWTSTYQWRTSFGQTFIHFPPLFGHQYSACWVDFRNIVDDFTASKNLTYFENSRRATLAQRGYCIANPQGFPGYGPNIWGLTACDGPGSGDAHSYMARGAPPAENDDGTIAPTAAGGSLPFAPEECIAALRAMYDRYRENIWCGYGFRDAFNLKEDWWGMDVIGIDQGTILIMAENLRTGSVWKRMNGNEVLQSGLKRAGFRPFQNEPRSGK
ncbi:MAG: glucoamylase family protein [Limisphaerales bacterium]